MAATPHPTGAHVAILIALIVASIGWLLTLFALFFNAFHSRYLQRKALAIKLDLYLSGDDGYNSSVKKIFAKIRSDPGYDWAKLANKRYGKAETGKPQYDDEEERALADSVVMLLNYYESFAVSVLNKAVDEDISKWLHRGILERLCDSISPFIAEATRMGGITPHAWCNVRDLCDQWREGERRSHKANPWRPRSKSHRPN